VSTGSPITSAHCPISLLVVKMIEVFSYISLTRLKKLFAWSFLMGVKPISSMMIKSALRILLSRKLDALLTLAVSMISTRDAILSKQTE